MVIAVAAMASAVVMFSAAVMGSGWAVATLDPVSVGVILDTASVGVTLDAFGGLVVTMITGALGMPASSRTATTFPAIIVRSPSKARRSWT